MDCERVKGVLSDYMERSLPESDLAEVDDHLRQCPPCASEAEGLKETIGLLHALPLVKAPPELVQKVRAEIARGTGGKPLWKKLFLPAHVKIPLEAAAVAALFLLVVATQREQVPKELPSAAPSSREAVAPAGDGKGATRGSVRSAIRADGRRSPAVRKGEDAPVRETPAEPAAIDAGRGARKAPSSPAPSAGAPMPAYPIPVVPARRISTEAGKIEAAASVPQEKTRENGGLPMPFLAPPSRLLRPIPFGRQVMIEVTEENRAGIEERIAAAAMKLGGSFARTAPRAGAPENTVSADPVLVHVPSDSAGTFLAELSQLGTLPEEGMSPWADLPAGPFPGVVAYTVRIRVR